MENMNQVEKKMDELFDELVPSSGKADTVAGEIVRAINRIVYRRWNDGDHLGVGYGKLTCNPAGRYLKAACGGEVAELVDACWGMTSEKGYSVLLDALMSAVIDYLEAHPETKTTPNSDDMCSYKDKDDDVDDSFDDEEEW